MINALQNAVHGVGLDGRNITTVSTVHRMLYSMIRPYLVQDGTDHTNRNDIL